METATHPLDFLRKQEECFRELEAFKTEHLLAQTILSQAYCIRISEMYDKPTELSILAHRNETAIDALGALGAELGLTPTLERGGSIRLYINRSRACATHPQDFHTTICIALL